MVGDVAVEVDAGGVARVLYHLAEDKGGGGELLVVYVLGAGVLKRLPVEGDGHGDVVVLDKVEDEEGLLGGLYGAHGLGEEVDAHVEPGVYGALHVLLELLVHEELALGGAAVAAAYHGKLYARVRDGLPVDVALVEGDVDAEARLVDVAGVDGDAVLACFKIRLGQLGDGHALGLVHPLLSCAGVHVYHALMRVGRGLRLAAAGGKAQGQGYEQQYRDKSFHCLVLSYPTGFDT